MSYVSSIQELLNKKPEYRKTIKLAIEKEDENIKKDTYLGWEWFDVETHPAKLIKLVTEGIAKVNFKSNSSTCYKLKDNDAARKVLEKIQD